MERKQKVKAILTCIFFSFCIMTFGHNIKNTKSFIDTKTDTLILLTKKKMGFSSLVRVFIPWNNFSKHPESAWKEIEMTYRGIPDSLKNLVISKNPLDWNQFVYQSYKNKQITQKVFDYLVDGWALDTTVLSTEGILSYFSIAIGQKSNNKWAYVIDKNGNSDFSDDSLHEITTFDNFYQTDNESLLKHAISYEYEHFRNESLIRDSSWIFINSPNSFTFFEFRICNFVLGGNKYEIEMIPKENSLQYGEYAHLGLTCINGEKIGLVQRKSQVKQGQYLNLNENYYKISKVSEEGDSIVLIKTLDIIAQGGTQLGMQAIDFSFKTLNGERYKLSDFRGKYLLIDFWGTWCLPCKKELPTLKKAYELFSGNNFDIIGVAYDRKEDLVNFLGENPLPWIQVPQYKNGNDSIIKMFNILSFPTTYLIDPTGKIININLRGETTIAKLESIFYSKQQLKKLALAGNSIFKLNAKKDYNSVKIYIYNEDADEIHQILMHYIDNMWMGSIDLPHGKYLYEFNIDGTRIPDPNKNKRRFSEDNVREFSIFEKK